MLSGLAFYIYFFYSDTVPVMAGMMAVYNAFNLQRDDVTSKINVANDTQWVLKNSQQPPEGNQFNR